MVAYEPTWKLQDELAIEIASGKRPPILLLLEHPHTYTFGRRGEPSNLLWDEGELTRRGVNVYWVDRGGDITYHGPGQLVGYPLILLKNDGLRVDPGVDKGRLPQADYIGYLRNLEQVIIRSLATFNISARPVVGLTGVWVDVDGSEARGGIAKIAAIGVKVDAKGVTRHGFALNVYPDMSYWDGIVGCGLDGYSITSLTELMESPPTMNQVIDSVVNTFSDVFEYRVVREVEG
jgi:lipoate-protein ligase B